MSKNLAEIYPNCWSFLNKEQRNSLVTTVGGAAGPESFAEALSPPGFTPPRAWLPDLARIEWAAYQAVTPRSNPNQPLKSLSLNPSLTLIETPWSGLARLYTHNTEEAICRNAKNEILLIWQPGGPAGVRIRAARATDLLALNIVTGDLPLLEISDREEIRPTILQTALHRAVHQGLILRPPSRLVRDPTLFEPGRPMAEKVRAPIFTLQWHLPQADLATGREILDQFHNFCLGQNVTGRVSFTGLSPILLPDFMEIYQAALDRGLLTAILGDPVDDEILQELTDRARPEFFQVSLEGLEPHNDRIRGPGQYQRILSFLDRLRAHKIYSTVMLTLTRDNLDQVLPLAETLRHRTDRLFFNRLAMAGKDTDLKPPEREEYAAFLDRFLQATATNPVLGLKDNLINIMLDRQGRELFGGCTGCGCGAAFNFMALLPNGEVHACRKFPSPIGNLNHSEFSTIYDSTEAARYRQGPTECRGCRIRHTCGGCLAVTYSHGLDHFTHRDPCCFI